MFSRMKLPEILPYVGKSYIYTNWSDAIACAVTTKLNLDKIRLLFDVCALTLCALLQIVFRITITKKASSVFVPPSI